MNGNVGFINRVFDVERFIWKYGGRFDFWIRNIDSVGAFIDEHKLEPIGREHFPMESSATEEGAEGAARPIIIRWPPPFPGGIRIAHFHFKGDIYLLNDKQWNNFTNTVVKGFQEKLASARAVDFGQLMELSETIDRLV